MKNVLSFILVVAFSLVVVEAAPKPNPKQNPPRPTQVNKPLQQPR